MKSLTDKQRAILDFISDFVTHEGMAPTISEISEYFSINPATALAHVSALQRKGYVNRSSKARSLTLTQNKKAHLFSMFLSIPLLGRISAGCPVLSEQNIERHIKIDPATLPRSVKNDQLFALKVQGESMRDAGILDGDIVIAQQTTDVSMGNVVIALVDGETTIKSLYVKNGLWELRPANPDFKSRFYPLDQLTIQGLLVMLIREY